MAPVLLLTGLAAIIYAIHKMVQYQRSPLMKIPTVGSSGLLSSYIDAFKFIHHSRDIIQEGYNKYYGSTFKVPLVNKWMVVVSGDDMVNDIRRASDDQLSFIEAVSDDLAIPYTIGPTIDGDPYHVDIVRGPLTRNIGAKMDDLRDEIVTAFADIIPATNEWTSLPALKTVQKLACRASNRIFVGLPLCRDPDYNKLNIEFTIDVVIGGKILKLFPNFLKPAVAYLFTNVPSSIRRGRRHLQPIIEERRVKAEVGSEKHGDFLSWLMNEAKGYRGSIQDLTLRILALNFAAIHTTSMAFTNALFNLTSHPELVSALREEVETVVAEHGWTKTSMQQMRKMDSFLKETQRLAGLGSIGMSRRALKDFTFSDGTVVPKGTFVAVAAFATHHDKSKYDHPDDFEAFRFSDMREEHGESFKHQFVTPDLEYVTFGHGRHACPGRFFAATELKLLLAHVLLTYDVKPDQEGVFPQPKWFAASLSPNPTAHVQFRKRAV